MTFLKSEEEISLIREGADILSRVHGEVARAIRPGVTTGRLDKLAEMYIRDHGGKPSFKNYKNFPASLCTSVNECVVHGLPNCNVMQEGDIVSVDCGVRYKGFHSDASFTYAVGAVSREVKRLLQVTKKALYLGIEAAKPGNKLGDVGYVIQHCVQKNGYSVIRELGGHGIGRNLHEDPEIPNYGKEGRGKRLRPGMVLAIEPMVNMGRGRVVRERGGQFRTFDRKPSAHFEHTVAVLENGVEILTTYRYIEEALGDQYG